MAPVIANFVAWSSGVNEGTAYAVITPAGGSTQRTLELWCGQGTVKFHRARWEDTRRSLR